MTRPRPHILGIDDGPFEKRQPDPVVIVAAMMEGQDLLEGVAVSSFPVDGDSPEAFLAPWIDGLRFRPSLQAVMLGGVTLAGLGVVDIAALSASLALPVLVVNRKDPANSRLEETLRSAGLHARCDTVAHMPKAQKLADGLYVAAAGIDERTAAAWVRGSCRKAQIPEALRMAHLIARAIATGQSRGRA